MRLEKGERSRFEGYFARVFAYMQHFTGNEDATRELVALAFTRVFHQSKQLRDEDSFRLALFRIARDLVETVRPSSEEAGLSDRERHLVSLIFDAQLNHAEVATLLHIREEAVTVELMGALEKLRSTMGPVSVPSFLRAT